MSYSDCSKGNRWNSQIFLWCKIFWLGVVQNGCDHSGHRTLKLALFQKWIDELNRFFSCWYKFREPKTNIYSFRVDTVKNGRGHSGHGTIKLAVSQEQIIKEFWLERLNACKHWDWELVVEWKQANCSYLLVFYTPGL